jgi:predicted transposase/invertase (TIGR01784 family)
MEKGIAQGRSEGVAQGVLQTAAALKNMGMSAEQIARATGLSAEQIARL